MKIPLRHFISYQFDFGVVLENDFFFIKTCHFWQHFFAYIVMVITQGSPKKDEAAGF